MKTLGLNPVEDLTDDRVVWTWTTDAGLDQGNLLIVPIDVPMESELAAQRFRRDPEWLYGEGIATSRAPLVTILYGLKALRAARRLRHNPLGVLVYSDEGRDCRYSWRIIQRAASRAKQVLVYSPGNVGDFVITARRGQRRYRLDAAGEPLRLGKATKKTEVLRWAFNRLEACAQLSSRKDRVAVSTNDIRTHKLPMLVPHEISATILVSYPDERTAAQVDESIRQVLKGDKSVKWQLEVISDRPPMVEHKRNSELYRQLKQVADQWELPLDRESSVWPSVAGLVDRSTPVVCGLGPVSRDLYTPQESVDRTSLLQRSLLLAEFLGQFSQKKTAAPASQTSGSL